MLRSRTPILLLLIALLGLVPRAAAGQETWLDGQRAGWNRAGMTIPAAPRTSAAESAYCQDLVRPAATSEDFAVTARGWRLIAAYERGWDITLIAGFVDFDAMCRPVPIQQFVFVGGVFAGTLAPEPTTPRVDGALTGAGISAFNRLYATFDRYAPTDALCCPSGETVVAYTIERTAAGPVVVPEGDSMAGTPAATPAAATVGAATAVCVGGGGEGLVLDAWTDDQIAAHEAAIGPVGRPHPATGSCTDPAGLPVLEGVLGGFSWVCSRTFDGLWYGPVWSANIYLAPTDVPPNPASGGCPEPHDASIRTPPDAELAAATAVYLSQLEAGDLTTLYAWLHPDAQAAIPEQAVVGWYAAEWIPLGPEPIRVDSVEFAAWTWEVTGTPYPRAARITYEQAFADGTVAGGVTHLVRIEQGAWRWFFGADAAFVTEQIDRFTRQGG